MPPNFLIENNEIKIQPSIDGGSVRNRADIWRAIVAVGVVFCSLVILLIGRVDLNNQKNFVVNKIIVPLSDIKGLQKNLIGGDVVVAPPVVEKPKLPQLIGQLKPTTDFKAESVIVKDVKSGAVLLGKNEYQKRSLASITKLMSALIVLEKNPNWSATTTVIGQDSLDVHMYAGDVYTLEDLWYSALVGSSNKAIISLAESLGWPEVAFVERMNQKALELGMTQTFFVDPSGLGEENFSSASDVAILINEAMKQEKISKALLTPEYSLYSRERKQKHHMYSTDWILLGWIPNKLEKFFGGKTGYTVAAGYNFTMRAGDSKGHLIDVVVLGASSNESRFTEARDAAEWAFANYQWQEELESL